MLHPENRQAHGGLSPLRYSTSHVVFPPATEEEIPMTMQVGMVGTDGILIAGDTQWTENQTAYRYSTNSTKFVIDEDLGIAISRAVSMETAAKMADEILSLYRQDQDWMSHDLFSISKLGTRVLDSVVSGREAAHCFVATTRPVPKLHLFKSVQLSEPNGKTHWGIVCNEVLTRTFAGDTHNSAVFWSERYYPRLSKVPIRNLVRLAAHTIVTARLLHNGGISGLEMILCDTSGIHRLPDQSIVELELQSIERDRAIGESLLSQEFAYA
jgi:hypothetical protein